jgi:exodeoxyribonuclease V alpha subunit
VTTHLSARLAWHDRGWDARVCDAAHLNASCIVHEHIRDSRDDEKERKAAGIHFADLPNWLPPCSRDPGAYADRGYVTTHRDPLDWRGLPAVEEQIPPFSSCPSPYRWMREENFQDICDAENLAIRAAEKGRTKGWVIEGDRQKALLKHFWSKIEPRKSLIFYYCNHGNPLDEQAIRIIVGVGRVAELGPQRFFGTTDRYQEELPVWSRRVTQDYPVQGVRIPYQEYLRAGHSTDEMICRVPRNALLTFSYVGEHVTDDIAVAILERVIQSIEQVQADGHVSGDWEARLAWLNDALAEVWTGRGPYPGIGSVLQYLGMSRGTAYQRFVLSPMALGGEDPWHHVLSILEGRAEPDEDGYRAGLLQARTRWRQLASRQSLLGTLTRFELTLDQVHRIADPEQRPASGIHATEEDIVANPYLLSEQDFGMPRSAPIALETIDHGMRPEGDAALFGAPEDFPQDDRRRVRAVAHAVLKEASDAGDTLLPFSDLLSRIRSRFPERRACNPDREVVVADREFLDEALWTALDEEPLLVALKDLQSLERHIASTIERRAPRAIRDKDQQIDWRIRLEETFGSPADEREEAAFSEKEKALETLFRRRLSILTGAAGTGKTSVMKVFLDTLDEVEGKQPILLVAPTGKARVRLSTTTHRNAMTIHQFLLRQGWLSKETFQLQRESAVQPAKFKTVVVDESSMIPTDLFGTLLRALDMNPLGRLILVGDPNQLPPIGPGRPFVDIIEWLQDHHPESLASLNVIMRRVEEEDSPTSSMALELASGYRADGATAGDDEILARVAAKDTDGDLRVEFWDDHDDLVAKLNALLTEVVGFQEGDYKAFSQSLGIADRDWSRAEAWQILSPTRIQYFGADDLNRRIQLKYKAGLINNARRKGPRPFGDQEIVWSDKVIQIVNQTKWAWPKKTGLDYVANGEVGIVSRTARGNYGPYLDVVFSTQPDVSYRYGGGDIDNVLQLAYALTVHKAQGSDFELVFLILPQSAPTLSRELLYTGLTRFRKKLVLLIQKDITPLLAFRNPETSETRLRNTHLFRLALRPEGVGPYRAEALIHRTRLGVAVRSKSEVIVADVLEHLGISYEYEKPLYSKSNSKDFRLPDFTVSYEGEEYFWEHLGMLSVPAYRERWERKLDWYRENGYDDRLLSSEDGPDGGIDARVIEKLARERILSSQWSDS